MELFNNPDYDIDGATSSLDIPELIRAACRGGWPATLHIKEKYAMLIAKDYVNSVCENDTSILADVTASEEISIFMDTLDDYVAALEKLYVIQDIDAWCPAIRSKTALRSTPKRCLVDPSIAVASLNINAEALETQLNTFGLSLKKCV